MVELDGDVQVAAPNVNVNVFGQGSIGDAVSGFLGGIVSAFADLTRTLTDEDKQYAAVVKVTSVMIVIATLIITYRSIGATRKRV